MAGIFIFALNQKLSLLPFYTGYHSIQLTSKHIIIYLSMPVRQADGKPGLHFLIIL